MVELLYLRDLLPGFSDHDEDGDGVGVDVVRAAMVDARLAPAIRHLEGLGEVSIGMCSSWEFCEL